MPKVIVLYAATDGSAAKLATAAAEGAKEIRFAEVDVRVTGDAEPAESQRQKRLDSAEQVRDYDGAIIATSGGDVPAALGELLDALESASPADGLANKVFAVAGDDAAALQARIGRLGGIVVSSPRGVADVAERAKALGKRVAKVSEWVRHALGHEAKDHHHH